jgi:hypothetical protein
MITLLQDLRLLFGEACRGIGLSATTANVAGLVVMGVVLNIAALNVVGHARIEDCPRTEEAVLRSATQTEFKVVRAVLVSTLKKIGDGQRRHC